jgi:putative hydrolase of the HAD superfamily
MNREAREIDSVVFDVGWVLVQLEYQPLLECLARGGFEPRTLPDVVAAIGLDAHERGELTGEELIDALLRLAPGVLDRAEVERHWLGMFRPVDTMFELARSLAVERRVHLLSNVGELHWQVLTRDLGLDRLGHHGALPSFEARAMKPDDRIYAEAERRFGLVPARTVFIDDLDANVAAARRRGWHAIQHRDPATTIAALGELGITA